VVWDARAAEHLINRAGFGARGDELEDLLALDLDGVVERLLHQPGPYQLWHDAEPRILMWEDFGLDHHQQRIPESPFYELSFEEQFKLARAARRVDRAQFLTLCTNYYHSAIDGLDPVRDRATLFWHSLLTTAIDFKLRKYELMRQFQWLRAHALSSYSGLLHGLVRDPAMLQYLDNTTNLAANPNENLARELMELYSLGEGHFSQHDVREAARALTGNSTTALGEYVYFEEHHDPGPKSILGVTGEHDADGLVEILLAHPQCARHVARRLLLWYEGVEPDEPRLEDYAACLREGDYDIKRFLGRLFRDPHFYSDAVVGARVKGGIEYVLDACHKLELHPSPQFMHLAMTLVGQTLYEPPSVKGWPEGLGWMEPDALVRRRNVIAVLTGASDLPGASPPETWPLRLREARECLGDARWDPAARVIPRLRSADPRTDAALARWLAAEWLAIPPPPETERWLTGALGELRAESGLDEGALLDDDQALSRLLVSAAPLIFGLPEAQLH
jgi:hypothetical protein